MLKGQLYLTAVSPSHLFQWRSMNRLWMRLLRKWRPFWCPWLTDLWALNKVGPGCLRHTLMSPGLFLFLDAAVLFLSIEWLLPSFSRCKQQHNNSFGHDCQKGFLVSPLCNQSHITGLFIVEFVYNWCMALLGAIVCLAQVCLGLTIFIYLAQIFKLFSQLYFGFISAFFQPSLSIHSISKMKPEILCLFKIR